MIGDHVWLGQNALILKGCRVGSGSVISAACVLANKTVESNSVYAGNPARKIRENIFYIGKSVHNYSADKTEESMHSKTDKFIYGKEGKPLDLTGIDKMLKGAMTAEERLEIIRSSIADCTDRNRFAVPQSNKRVSVCLFK
jgi:hypothetical protein